MGMGMRQLVLSFNGMETLVLFLFLSSNWSLLFSILSFFFRFVPVPIESGCAGGSGFVHWVSSSADRCVSCPF